MDSGTFVVVENISLADGVYVACIYPHARWSLRGLYLLACQVEFMWPVFARMPGGVYVACIYSHAAPSLCGLYLPACQVEFTWPVLTRMPGRVYVACIDSHARSSLCALYLLACRVEFMCSVFTRMPCDIEFMWPVTNLKQKEAQSACAESTHKGDD